MVSIIVGGTSQTSIALDNNNYPHICYTNATGADLKYAYWTGSTWNNETVDSLGNNVSIALDDNGFVHISYYDWSDLKYANNIPEFETLFIPIATALFIILVI